MSDELSNAASEWVRNALRHLNELESPPSGMRVSLTDDYVYEDRRHGPSFPSADAESFPQALETLWDTGAGRPRFTVHEILAVRGDRTAACRLSTDYPNGWTTESIQVVRLDASLSLMQRKIDFDHDDLEGAIAELDRLQSQADAT